MIAAHTVSTAPMLGWDPSTWAAVVHGRSSILFAVLAGVSVALMTGGPSVLSGGRLRDARTRLLVRAVLIFTTGAVLTVVSSSVSIILQVYAVLVVAVLPVLRWSVRRLLALAGVLVVVSPVVDLLGTYVVARWSSPLEPGEISMLVLGGPYPAVVWLAFVVLGLIVGRLDLTSVRVAARLLLVGIVVAAAGYTAGWATTRLADARGWSPETAVVSHDAEGNVTMLDGDGGPVADPAGGTAGGTASSPAGSVRGEDLDLTGRTCRTATDGSVVCGPAAGDLPQDAADQPPAPQVWQLLGAREHSGTSFEILGSGGTALAVLGLCLLVARGAGRRVLYPVRAAGSMPLSIYTAHVVFLEAVGDRIFSHGELLFVTQVVVALVTAGLWSWWRGQGPMERLVATVARRTVTGA